jgi:hypothetical protein
MAICIKPLARRTRFLNVLTSYLGRSHELLACKLHFSLRQTGGKLLGLLGEQ